jgi:hypothetical protein
MSRGAEDWGEPCELVELEFVINELCKIRALLAAMRSERERQDQNRFLILAMPIDISTWRFH